MTKHRIPYAETLGLDVRTLKRNWVLVGKPGHGKTWTILNTLIYLLRRGAGMTIFDNAGRLYAELEKWVAEFADQLLDALTTADRYDIIERQILSRFIFAYLGSSYTQRHGMDVTKRRRKPDGTRESVKDVVDGVKKTFEMRFHDDLEMRQTFLESTSLLLPALIAGNRPITEADTLLHDADYWSFLLSQIDAAKTMQNTEDRRYVEPKLRRLRQYLDTRFRKAGDGYAEIPPFPRDFRDQFGSTIRAFEPFYPTSRFSQFFSKDTIDLERVAYRDGVLVLATDETSQDARQMFFSACYAAVSRYQQYRVPTLRTFPRHYNVADDFASWANPVISNDIATFRNYNVSWIIAYQDGEQFRRRKLDGFDRELEGLCAVQTHYRPELVEKAETLARKIHRTKPMAMTFRYETTGTNETNGWSQNDTEGWGETESHGTHDSSSEGSSRSSAWNGNNGSSTSVSYDADGNPHYTDSHNDGGGWSDTDSSTSGSSSGTSSSHGTSRSGSATKGTSGARGRSRTENLHIVSMADQSRLVADDILSMHRFESVTIWDDPDGVRRGKIVRMTPFRPSSPIRNGRPILDRYREALQAFVKAKPRASYQSSIPVTKKKRKPTNFVDDKGGK